MVMQYMTIMCIGPFLANCVTQFVMLVMQVQLKTEAIVISVTILFAFNFSFWLIIKDCEYTV